MSVIDRKLEARALLDHVSGFKSILPCPLKLDNVKD